MEKGKITAMTTQLPDEDKEFLANAETLSEALMRITKVFHIPVTEEEPHFDPFGTPIYHVSEFMSTVESAIARYPDEVRELIADHDEKVKRYNEVLEFLASNMVWFERYEPALVKRLRGVVTRALPIGRSEQ